MAQSRHTQYWQRFLLPNEQLVHAFGVSGAYVFLFWGLPLLALDALALWTTATNVSIATLLFIASLGLLLPIVYLLFFIHYAITDRRVLAREGVLHKRFVTVELRSITDVTVNESLLERLFTKTGTIGVNTAGSPQIELFYHHIRRPFNVRQDIYHHLQQAPAPTGSTPPFAT
ncbi:MAG: PH domain-containing protein [Candidatus Andersenbacteria bacterium]|nr:PH domain-containing protein [Candidatus Andersenbacteria bacterium]